MPDNIDPEVPDGTDQKPATPSDPDLDKKIESLVAERLKDIKGRLDAVYGERDTYKKQAAEMADKLSKAERERLVAEGKELEALKLQLAEVEAKNSELQSNLVAATRDSQLQAMLGGLPFRTDKARQQALREITADLRQTSDGTWVTKDGADLSTYVKAYADDSENTYLFKPQASSGGGASSQRPATPGNEKKSLFAMSQDEVLKMAREGKLRR
jgi:hypothetical protein